MLKLSTGRAIFYPHYQEGQSPDTRTYASVAPVPEGWGLFTVDRRSQHVMQALYPALPA
jgi:hypothetical protein